ncbi:hypothetical protein ACGFXB_17650, partial [Streptomyces canus]|uniref:hypothetical protein n=1 Tax=Streptomyces canus TaxID=58343 RepID=UPI0037178029
EEVLPGLCVRCRSGLAGDGLLAGRVPADLHPVVADGYQHLDVLTAAPVQNNGRPEPVSTALAAFARTPR